MARDAAALQITLAAAYEAQTAALVETYTLDSGQGRQTATRNLAAITTLIAQLESELDGLTEDPNPSITFERESV